MDREALTAAYMAACKDRPSDWNEIGYWYFRQAWEAAIKAEREACAKVCEAMQDATEEKRALAAFNAAAGKPSQTAALSRGQHWSAVNLYNCAFRNAAVAIRERLDS